MKYMIKGIVILSIIASCIACDQASKSIAANSLDDKQIVSYLGNTVVLKLAYNDGAFLSILSSLPKIVKFILLQGGVSLVLISLLVFIILNQNLTMFEVSSYALIIGGGIGNLIDRIIQDGKVTDFLNFGIGSIRTGVLNIADLQITFGFILLLAFSILHQKKNKVITEKPEETSGSE